MKLQHWKYFCQFKFWNWISLNLDRFLKCNEIQWNSMKFNIELSYALNVGSVDPWRIESQHHWTDEPLNYWRDESSYWRTIRWDSHFALWSVGFQWSIQTLTSIGYGESLPVNQFEHIMNVMIYVFSNSELERIFRTSNIYYYFF